MAAKKKTNTTVVSIPKTDEPLFVKAEEKPVKVEKSLYNVGTDGRVLMKKEGVGRRYLVSDIKEMEKQGWRIV